MQFNALFVMVSIMVSVGSVFTAPMVLSAFAIDVVEPSVYCENTKSGKIKEGECPGNSEKSPNKRQCGPIRGCVIPADPL